MSWVGWRPKLDVLAWLFRGALELGPAKKHLQLHGDLSRGKTRRALRLEVSAQRCGARVHDLRGYCHVGDDVFSLTGQLMRVTGERYCLWFHAMREGERVSFQGRWVPGRGCLSAGAEFRGQWRPSNGRRGLATLRLSAPLVWGLSAASVGWGASYPLGR